MGCTYHYAFLFDETVQSVNFLFGNDKNKSKINAKSNRIYTIGTDH